MVLTWDKPSLTDSYSICVDVYQVNHEPGHVGGLCYGNMSTYKFVVDDPSPEVLYKFVVTVRYDVRGAKNGTQSNATGYFIGGTFTELCGTHTRVSVHCCGLFRAKSRT